MSTTRDLRTNVEQHADGLKFQPLFLQIFIDRPV
jgi:hypothetical protein